MSYKQSQPEHHRRGYIAIVAVLIVGAFVMTLAVSVGLSAYITRIHISTSHYKEISHALAEGCLQKALLKLSQDSNYAGGETFAVGEDECEVVAVETDGANKVIKVQGVFRGAESNIELTVAEDDLAVVSWREVQSF